MSLQTFTIVHVIISLVAIATGLVFAFGLLADRSWNAVTDVFLWTTVLTSVTGFMFPFKEVTPGIVLGAISLLVLAAAFAARSSLQRSGRGGAAWVVSSLFALYLNVFVLVVQSFEKSPFLHALAPTQKEPPFAIAQLVVLAFFVGVTTLAVKKSRLRNLRAAGQ